VKAVSYGRFIFGLSALMLGVITLMWHDADAWEGLPILSLPFGAIIGDILALAQIFGGIAMLSARSARPASIVLGAVYVIFSLASIPPIVAAPTTYAPYVGFFEFFSLVFGALASYAATQTSAERAEVLGRLARLGFGICTVSFMLAQIAYPKITADLVPKWIPPNPMFWMILTTIAFGLAAIAILINRQARLALRLMTLMLALFGVLVWVPILIAHPEGHFNWSEFALNYLITGSAGLVAQLRSF
jgi:hypothetical protein